MATTSTITALATLSSVATDDVLPIVDVSDTTQAPSGSTKKLAVSTLLASVLPLVGGTLTGALHISSGGAVITGTVEASNLVSDGTLTVASTATFSAGITVGNSGITSSGALSVTAGGASITGGLTVPSGASTINGTLTCGAAVTLQAALAHTGTTAGFFGTAARGKPSLTYPTTYTLSNFEQSVLILLSEIGLVSYTQSGTNWVVS